MYTKLLKDFMIDELAICLNKGGVVAFPTDTVFGLACIYDDPIAIQRVKDIKGRDASKPLPMMCDGADMMCRVAKIDKGTKRVIDAFCPGALTLILPKSEDVEDYVTNGFKTIGIRIPDKREILDLISVLAKPILVTSCNMSGEPSIKDHQKIVSLFEGKLDMIVLKDAKTEVASTIIYMTDKEPKLIREGAIKIDAIKEVYYA